MGKVCRSWNELRTRPGMFADLSDDSGLTCRGLRDLIHLLPPNARSSITGIRLHCLENIDDSFGKLALYKIAKANGDTLSAIVKIVFSGPGVSAYGSFFQAARLGIGPSLHSCTMMKDPLKKHWSYQCLPLARILVKIRWNFTFMAHDQPWQEL